MIIRLIVGLGNPGSDYEKTRHNVGFWVIDAIARTQAIEFRAEARFNGEVCRITEADGNTCWLLKPMTFMNRSGQALAAVAYFYKIVSSEILVIHDDLDLTPGVARLKQGGGHGGHNGLRDIIQHLGNDFLRLRLGIGHPGDANAVINYVLHQPSHADATAIHRAITEAINVLPWIRGGELQKAMNQLHRFKAQSIDFN